MKYGTVMSFTMSKKEGAKETDPLIIINIVSYSGNFLISDL